jgi:VanZ family protein
VSPGPDVPGRRLAAAFLYYAAGVVLVLALAPFDFRLSPLSPITLRGSAADVLANLLLFLPLGFLHRLRGPSTPRPITGLLIRAGLFSLAIEGAQLFLPSRFPSPLDLGANVAGAALGGLLQDHLATRIRLSPGFVGRLGLELPLMGVPYLLVPLLWLDTLALAQGSGSPFAPALLGLAGALVLGAVYRRRAGGLERGSLRHVIGLTAVWFLTGASPGLMSHPATLVGSLVFVVAAAGLAALVSAPPGADRRFEVPVLARVAPVLAVYLVMVVTGPGRPVFGRWSGRVGLPEGWEALGSAALIRLLEHEAAFALLGYAVAESLGRLEQPYRRSVIGVVGSAGALGLLLELVAGFLAGAGASGLRILGALVTAGLGGALYHFQRDQVRRLRAGPGVAGRLPVRGSRQAGTVRSGERAWGAPAGSTGSR